MSFPTLTASNDPWKAELRRKLRLLGMDESLATQDVETIGERLGVLHTEYKSHLEIMEEVDTMLDGMILEQGEKAVPIAQDIADIKSMLSTPARQPDGQTGPVFQLIGDYYKIEFDGESGTIKKSVALKYLHKVIEANGKPLTIADLRGDAAEKIKADMRIRDDKVHDGKSLADIRRRVEEIDDLTREIGGSERLESEKCELLKHLGDDDRIIGSAASTTADTIKRQLRDLWPKLAAKGLKIASQHFESAVSWEGFSVAYKPAKCTSWKT